MTTGIHSGHELPIPVRDALLLIVEAHSLLLSHVCSPAILLSIRLENKWNHTNTWAR